MIDKNPTCGLPYNFKCYPKMIPKCKFSRYKTQFNLQLYFVQDIGSNVVKFINLFLFSGTLFFIAC